MVTCGRRMLLPILVIALLLASVSSCAPSSVPEGQPTTQPALFDLQHPLDGWYRTVDPLAGYVLWLPPNWQIYTTPEWADWTRQTYYVPKAEGVDATVSISCSNIVDQTNDPRAPFEMYADHPMQRFELMKQYTVTVASSAMHCARYEFDWNGTLQAHRGDHVRVILGPQDAPYFYELWFQIARTQESEYDSAWQPMVASFVLERQPQATESWQQRWCWPVDRCPTCFDREGLDPTSEP